MHILVTGGTGWFGKALLRHWAAAEQEDLKVTVLSRNPEGFRARHASLINDAGVALVRGDVTDPATLPTTSGEFTHVLHAAAESTSGPTLTTMQRYEHSVTGTKNILDLAVRLGVPRVLYTSSGGVYGPMPDDMTAFPENYLGMPDPLEPANAYSVAKRIGEHLCALYAEQYGLQTVIARCFAFVGEDLPLNAHFAIGNFIRDAAAGGPIVVRGDGTPVRSYLDQRDLARWLITLMTDGKPGRAYNVGSPEALCLRDVAQLVASIQGDCPVEVLGTPTGGKTNRYVPDVSRARHELNLTATIPLSDSVRYVLQGVLA